MSATAVWRGARRAAWAMLALATLLGMAGCVTLSSIAPTASAAHSIPSTESPEPSSSPLGLPLAARFAAGTFHMLCYHDIFASADAPGQPRDAGALTVAQLVRHFSWLRDNGYSIVTWDQIIASRSGGAPLPAGAVVLTFDDAYESFYSQVLPLLRLFNYPAILAVVPRWIDEPNAPTYEYEAGTSGSARFMSWPQIRDARASGLVEIASHSFDSHVGHAANAMGNKQPALVTRRFDIATQSYEGEAAFQQRVRVDLEKSRAVLAERLGVAPRILVWPYGAHSDLGVSIARSVGFSYALTLDPGPNTPNIALTAARRDLMEFGTSAEDIEIALRPRRVRTERMVSLDLADIVATDAATTEARLGALLDRVIAIKPTAVILSAQAGALGAPRSALFNTATGAVLADIANRAAWQLRTRSGVRVFFEAPFADASLPPQTTLALQEDLARRAAFAGFVFPEIASDAAVRDGTLALKRQRAPVETIRRVSLTASCRGLSVERFEANTTLVAALTSAATDADWTLLNVRTDPAARCSLQWWQSLSRFVAGLRHGVDRTVIEIDYVRTADASQTITAPLLTAYAAGFRHLAYRGDLYREGLPELAQIRPAISTETHPVKR